MLRHYFITGTDTGVGKTYVTCELLRHFDRQGMTALGMKPIASGCQQTKTGLRNEDAELIQAAASYKLPYNQINPFAFEPPIAPHIAAEKVSCELNLSHLRKSYEQIIQYPHEVLLIEGAGGWLTPLNQRESLADFAASLSLEIIVVVGMRLGCLNHALLTMRAIESQGGRVAGWVANSPESEMPYYKENLDTLKGSLSFPCLGEVKFEQEMIEFSLPNPINVL